MVTQISSIQLPNVSALSDKFTALSEFSIELPTLSDVSIAIPQLDLLSGVVNDFTEIVQTLPSNPDELIADLTAELKNLTSGSLSIGDLLGNLTDPFTDLGAGLQNFQPVFDNITTALSALSPQQIDSDYISQLLPVTTLLEQLPQTSFTDLIEGRLDIVEQVQTQAESLATELATQAYEAAAAQITALPLDNLTADALSQLNLSLDTVQGAIATVENTSASALQTAEGWIAGLDDSSAALTSTLDLTLTLLEPAQLAALSQPLGAALSAYPIPASFGATLDQMDTALEAVNSFVDQGIDTVTGTLDTGVKAVGNAIITVKQTVVKVSSLVTDAIEQVVGFIQSVDLTGLVNQARLLLEDLMAKINGIFNQVNGIIGTVFDQVRGLIQQVDDIDIQPVVDAVHSAIAQITAFLEHPQVASVIQQAKDSIDAVVQKLEPITLEPVFDQVLTEADKVKTSLQAIDVSQLNAVLKQALSTALNLLKEALDPATKVTDIVKDQYHETVTVQVLQEVVDPVRATINQAVDKIYAFEPGKLVGELLLPPYETMVAKVEEFVDPDQLVKLLQPVTDLQENLLTQVDDNINPKVVFEPLMALYDKLMTFVRSLSADQIITPVNALIGQAMGYLDALNLETIVAKTVQSIRQITNWISSLRLEDQAFWQPIQSVLDTGIRPILNSLINKVKSVVQNLNLSGIESIVAQVRDVASPVVEQVQNSQLLETVKSVVNTIEQTAHTYTQSLTAHALTWQNQLESLSKFAPLPAIKASYEKLMIRLRQLDPTRALSIVTRQVDRLVKLAKRAITIVESLWTKLKSRLAQAMVFLDDLTTNGADGLKNYLLQAVDALTVGPVEAIVNWASPLDRLKPLVAKILDLQRVVKVVEQVPNAIENVGNQIIDLKDQVQGFNLSFLTKPLNRVRDEVIKPLAALNPKTALVIPVTQLYSRVMRLLQRMSPAKLLATARGKITLTAPADLATSLTIPAGSSILAKTPIGDIWFESTTVAELSTQTPTVEIAMQALIAGESSDIVTDKDVTWQLSAPDFSAVAVSRTAAVPTTVPITPSDSVANRVLSLVTLVKKVLLAKLEKLHPITLIAQPLDAQFQNVVALVKSLGLAELFDAFFEKLAQLSEEIETGLDKVGGAIGGVLAAMPL